MIAVFTARPRVEGQFFVQLRPLLQIEAPVGTTPRSTQDICLDPSAGSLGNEVCTFCNHRTYVTRRWRTT